MTNIQKIDLDEHRNIKLTYYANYKDNQKRIQIRGFSKRLEHGIRKMTSNYLEFQQKNYNDHYDIKKNLRWLSKQKLANKSTYVNILDDLEKTVELKEKGLLERIYGVSLKLLGSLQFYPDMKNVRLHYRGIFYNSIVKFMVFSSA